MRHIHRKRITAKPITRIFFLAAIIFTLFSFCESRVKLLQSSVIEISAKAFTQEKINEVIKEKFLEEGSSYKIYFDDKNKVAALETDAVKITELNSEIASELNYILNGRHTTYIPIGNLLNSNLLNGYGFKVPISIYFNGTAKVDIKSEIVSAGVNQSNFKLTAVITAVLCSNSMTNAGDFTISGEYLLCETVFLGDTPMLTRAS